MHLNLCTSATPQVNHQHGKCILTLFEYIKVLHNNYMNTSIKLILHETLQ